MEQDWRSVESARLPPMCPEFDSQAVRHTWAEFTGSVPCSEGFSPGTRVSPFPQKPVFNLILFDLSWWMNSATQLFRQYLTPLLKGTVVWFEMKSKPRFSRWSNVAHFNWSLSFVWRFCWMIHHHRLFGHQDIFTSSKQKRDELLEAWLAAELTSVKYHDNLLVLMLLNQWLALTSVKYHDNLLVLILL